jgi:hypothetical protein
MLEKKIENNKKKFLERKNWVNFYVSSYFILIIIKFEN